MRVFEGVEVAGEEIAVEDDEVGQLARLKRTDLIVEKHQVSIAGRVESHGLLARESFIEMTPAMKAGIAEYPMTMEDLVEMLLLPAAKNRGKYKPRAKA